jgi:hypothetical protein
MGIRQTFPTRNWRWCGACPSLGATLRTFSRSTFTPFQCLFDFQSFLQKLNSPQPIAQMAKSMKDNKAIRMLKAAEEGEYGVIGVVSVCPLPTQYPL